MHELHSSLTRLRTSIDARAVSFCLKVLLSAIHAQCRWDILNFHLYRPHLKLPRMEELPLITWHVMTTEPAYEPLDEEDDAFWGCS